MNCLLIEEAREEQPQQIHGDGRDGAFGGKVFAVEMVDSACLCVRDDELIGKLGDRYLHDAEVSGKMPANARKGKESSKIQISSSKEAPMSNLQVSDAPVLWRVLWSLRFLWSLVPGIGSFHLSISKSLQNVKLMTVVTKLVRTNAGRYKSARMARLGTTLRPPRREMLQSVPARSSEPAP